MTVPTWVQDSIFYQIFPDRFADGDPANNPPNVLPWNTSPTSNGFHGGDLKGIIDRLYYLQDLGITALYLNPIFLAPSNHGYNATDYYKIDPKLGTGSDFAVLVDAVHRLKMKVVLDGVFNHCGRGFFAFSDILENQIASPYKDWFHIRRFPIDAYTPGDAVTYEGWWKFKSLPKFNTKNPAVRKYIMGVARYWIEQGIDGWRLDVPNEIDDDDFWAEFRDTVRNTNPEAYLLGEIWDGNKRWVNDNHFDGLMNYPLRTLILDLLSGKTNPQDYSSLVSSNLAKFNSENTKAMYNLLGSHDTERFLTMVNGSLEKAKLGYLLLFTLPGAPAIYYGDEVGLTGSKDPDCRKAFPWDESNWNRELRDWIKKLIRIRRDSEALRRGEVTYSNENGILAQQSRTGNQIVTLLVNVSNHSHDLSVDNLNIQLSGQTFVRNMMGLDIYQLQQGQRIKLNPLSGVLIAG